MRPHEEQSQITDKDMTKEEATSEPGGPTLQC